MNVAAEEISGLVLGDEVADGARAGVETGADLVERGAIGRRVADEDERVEGGEGGEVRGEFRLPVFAGGVEGRGAGVAEAGDAPGAELEVALVEIVEAVSIAEGGNLRGGFVVAGEYPNLTGARMKNLAGAIEAFAEGDLIAGGDVEIGLHGKDALERLPIVVDVGEYE